MQRNIGQSALHNSAFVHNFLKTRARRTKAKLALRQFSRSKLRVYAIKELKAGALSNYVWLHNKLAETRSVIATYSAITRNMRQPSRF